MSGQLCYPNAYFITFYFVILISSFELSESRPVVNGTDGKENEFPYIVSLRDRDNDHFCGGGIIAEEYILSAYHCLSGDYLKQIRVVAGTNSLVKAEPKYTFGIERVYHFNNKKWLRAIGKVYDDRHDLMILKLNGKIPISDKAKIAKLPRKPPIAGTLVTFAGWGVTNSTRLPDPIQKLETVIQPLQVCEDATEEGVFFTPYEMCTFAKEGQGLCDGDSGSPLVKNGVLIGVALWVDEICGSGSPDYFANVYYYEEFIRKHLHEYETIYNTPNSPECVEIEDFFENETLKIVVLV